MEFWSVFLIACALAADTSAVSLCKGFSVPKIQPKHYAIVAVYFGGFHAGMPLLGYALGISLTSFIARYDHWVAFALLCFIGLKMVKESFDKHNYVAKNDSKDSDFGYKIMLPLAIATSIDTLAVGISLAVLDTHIFANALCIGLITAIFSMLALKLGHRFGLSLANRFANKVELLGGAILVLIGAKILIEHLNEGI